MTSRRASAPPASESGGAGSYRGARGLDPHIVADIKKMFGFDKPPLTRFIDMVGGYLRFDFGRSFFRDQTVLQLILQKMPVSISLGLWSTLLVYFISIPLGIAKAVRDGSRFDVASSAVVLVGYAIPSFLFAILLVVLFAGGSFFHWFPLRGLTSEGAANWSLPARVADYAWHMVLPTIADGGQRLRQPDDADQELLPRGDPQAVHGDGPRQGRQRAGACCTATCSATPCC